MAIYECENCKKQFDSWKRSQFECPKCGSTICAVCVKEVRNNDFSESISKYCPICNQILEVF